MVTDSQSWLDILSFFFSSRRRHTRLVSDWSSDVCSSDLCWSTGIRTSVGSFLTVSFFSALLSLSAFPMPLHPESVSVSAANRINAFENFTAGSPFQRQAQDRREIGRASCRERRKISVGDE